MKKPAPPKGKTIARTASQQGGFVLGRERFERISAVEGMRLSGRMRDTLDGFERDGLSAEERRHAIIRNYAPKR